MEKVLEDSGRGTVTLLLGGGTGEPVGLEEDQVFGDESFGQAGQKWQFFSRELGGEQTHPFESPEVAVDCLFGVVGASRDVRSGEAL
jgi:hypothetical protein